MSNRFVFPAFFLLAAGPLAAQPATLSSARSDWVSIRKEPTTAPLIAWQVPQAKRVVEHKLTYTVTVRVQAADAVTRLQFVRNGLVLNRETRGFKRAGGVEFSEVIPLVPGSNELYVMATNAIGTTTSEPRLISCQPDTSLAKQVPVAGVSDQKRLALIVANGNYGKSLLRNPTNDGRAIKQQLEKLGFAVTYKENLPLRELKQTFDGFMTDLGSHNVGLFYYAGHGLMVGGENYVQPVDAEPKVESDVEFECYPLRQLVARMAYANPKGANLIFWDACRNNPYRSWRRGAGESMVTPLLPAVGTMIVFATEPGKQSYDGDEENGLFTGELLKHLGQPGIDIFELVDRIDQGLEDRGFKQPPYLEGRLRGKFMFNAN
ncbi:caspase family protein [Fibrella sp. HMF5335]|uniref:Caspase family protein n=1 Tax=Fibrella rubiginis TaxID=2817060 RepID=A0A939K3M0_9BACT|nr:caspase family protein [Fibrella rubiginis]MBO0935276.1 caspase family protein [Fibrella rubiginis]